MSKRCGIILTVSCSVVVLTGCASPAPAATPVVTPATPAPAPIPITPCVLPPLVAPAPPARIPEYLALDPDTNLHMTGKVQQIDVAPATGWW